MRNLESSQIVVEGRPVGTNSLDMTIQTYCLYSLLDFIVVAVLITVELS